MPSGASTCTERDSALVPVLGDNDGTMTPTFPRGRVTFAGRGGGGVLPPDPLVKCLFGR